MKPDCHFCRRRVRKINWHHHPIPKSEGGTKIVPCCQRCHKNYHIQRNDFSRWGQRGGKRTAALKYWIANLKWGKSKPDAAIQNRRIERLILGGLE